ncbi:hypothetical protein A2U13_08770 [Fusobacterium necrophorum subsp. funduliforme]|uniref:hypothetical protein n=1 Tax=Fusobacterium necrophorum TaxID=859 RepID=UPI000788671C|nr:hypothetical protein [Fusobacterium necrophorum]KYM67109.1 hypothetical protein A2U13_08770 [Fusobacterium necrophorum subsp. funduliforme]
MSKKYKFTGEERIIQIGSEKREVVVKRIVALKDFSDVAEGDLGGWIQYKPNLSQSGDCWVYDDACICENARVYGDAMIDYGSIVSGQTKISGSVKVSGAKIGGDSSINGDVKIRGEK